MAIQATTWNPNDYAQIHANDLYTHRQCTADTKFEGVTKSFADLKAGMQAEVGGASQSDGSFLAAKVEASNGNDARQRRRRHQQES